MERKYSDLTKVQKEMIHCLLEMNFCSKEIASLTNLSRRSIGVAKGNLNRVNYIQGKFYRDDHQII